MTEDIWQQGKVRSSMIYGAWFYESHGIPETKEGGVPVRGWSLIEIIPGKFRREAINYWLNYYLFFCGK